MTKPRGRRHIEVKPLKHALRAETRRRDAPAGRARPRRIVTKPEPPRPAWSLGQRPSPAALQAVEWAHEIFGNGPAVDACLGWLFARLPALGGEGDDMVAHHARLSSERYYAGWVDLCRRLSLFGRDP